MSRLDMDKWTPSDEEAFQQLSKRRDELRGKSEAAVRLVASVVNRALDAEPREPPPLQSERDQRLARAMILQASEIRAALEPFDTKPNIGLVAKS